MIPGPLPKRKHYGPGKWPMGDKDSENDPIPKIPTTDMLIAGARSIGNTMRQENHNERARECWQAMCDAYLHGTIQPKPKGKSK